MTILGGAAVRETPTTLGWRLPWRRSILPTDKRWGIIHRGAASLKRGLRRESDSRMKNIDRRLQLVVLPNPIRINVLRVESVFREVYFLFYTVFFLEKNVCLFIEGRET